MKRDPTALRWRLSLDGWIRLGLARERVNEWLRGEGLAGPLHCRAIEMLGPKTAAVEVSIVTKHDAYWLWIEVALRKPPPPWAFKLERAA